MGALHARAIASSDRVELDQVIDLDLERADNVARAYGRSGSTPGALVHADAAVIASPTSTHADLAIDLLGRGIPVLVEKPLAPNATDVDQIVRAARAGGTVLMCGFVERFNPVIMAAQDLLDGPVVHWVSVRHSPPAGRPTSHVATDLLIHDVDLALRLHGVNDPARPQLDIDGHLPSITGGLGEEVADCTIAMNDGAVATLSASRIGQRKVREVRIMTAGSQFELDLLRQDITIYRHLDHGPGTGNASYRSETVIEVPFVRAHQEPVASQLDHFCDLIAGDADPVAELASLWMPHHLMDRLCNTTDRSSQEIVMAS